MKNLIQKIFKKGDDDDVPEMKLPKTEKKSYYNTEHKCWMFEGEEEEILKQLTETKKPPPRRHETCPNPTGPSRGQGQAARERQNTMNRYAPVLPVEPLSDNTSNVVRQDESVPGIKDNYSENIQEERKEMNIDIDEEETNNNNNQGDKNRNETQEQNNFNNTLFVFFN